MKRTLILVGLCLAAIGGLRAQDCEAIMLPFFGGDKQKMHEYPAPKFDIRCRYSQNAFYVTDQIPEGAEMRSLTEIADKMTGEKLGEDFRVDLNTLSYYRYTFSNMQLSYPKGNVTICFATPASDHKYLVLRSLDETYFRTEYPEKYSDAK